MIITTLHLFVTIQTLDMFTESIVITSTVMIINSTALQQLKLVLESLLLFTGSEDLFILFVWDCS
jgi:ethanolamine utilization microcompartment shell protein EutS